MGYATTDQLAAYLGVDEDDLSADSSRLLERASELIDTITLGRYDPETADQVVIDRVVRATCAQVEYWNEIGEAADIDAGGLDSYRVGSVSVKRARAGASGGGYTGSRLAPRAREALFMAGLLNQAVKIRGGW